MENIKKTNLDNGNKKDINDEEIDLLFIVKFIWGKRKVIYRSIIVFLLLGVIIIIVSPVKYSVSSTILPSAENKDLKLGGGLGALAGMAGINLNSIMGENAGIPADLYPEIAKSISFRKELIHKKVFFGKYQDSISVYSYLTDSAFFISDILLDYTIKLPWTIKKNIFKEKFKYNNTKELGIFSLSKEEQEVLENTEDLVDVGYDELNGLVYVNVEAWDAIATTMLNKEAVNLLQKHLINYKTSKAKESLKFLQALYEEKKYEYERIQKEFFEYKDRHRNVDPNRIDRKYQQLSDEYDIITSVFKGLSQQLEQAKITVKEQTPAFSLLNPPVIPEEKSSPKKKVILLVSFIIGLFVGIGLVLGNVLLEKLRYLWNNN